MIVGVPADRPVVVIAVNEAGRGVGLSAGHLVGGAARALGGGGGGEPDIAQGGGAPRGRTRAESMRRLRLFVPHCGTYRSAG